jgi:hypothetical protein
MGHVLLRISSTRLNNSPHILGILKHFPASQRDIMLYFTEVVQFFAFLHNLDIDM